MLYRLSKRSILMTHIINCVFLWRYCTASPVLILYDRYDSTSQLRFDPTPFQHPFVIFLEKLSIMFNPDAYIEINTKPVAPLTML